MFILPDVAVMDVMNGIDSPAPCVVLHKSRRRLNVSVQYVNAVKLSVQARDAAVDLQGFLACECVRPAYHPVRPEGVRRVRLCLAADGARLVVEADGIVRAVRHEANKQIHPLNTDTLRFSVL